MFGLLAASGFRGLPRVCRLLVIKSALTQALDLASELLDDPLPLPVLPLLPQQLLLHVLSLPIEYPLHSLIQLAVVVFTLLHVECEGLQRRPFTGFPHSVIRGNGLASLPRV
jgi:hypothetical protein